MKFGEEPEELVEPVVLTPDTEKPDAEKPEPEKPASTFID